MGVSAEFLQELPKCEHHLHLEGTLEPSLLFQLAEQNGIVLPENFPSAVEELEEIYKAPFKDLQDFLDYYYIGVNVLVKEDDFYQLAWEYFTKVSEQGLVHAEVFFDPQSHTSRDISLDTVTRGFERACRDAGEKYGISTKLIMCLLRHLPAEEGLETVEQAKHLIEDGTISGLGLDSAEKPYPPGLFVECYEKAASYNPDLKLTAHAGEEGDAQYVKDALDLLSVTRIDHGVRSVEDPELLTRLANERILLTVCPLSNVKLQVFDSVKDVPMQQFLDAGVPFSINSDDPAYFGGYILDNYLEVARQFPDWDYATWGRIARNAVEGSWCDTKRKQELLHRIDAVLERYQTV